MLEFATIDGANACALGDKTGSLTPGKQADIVLLQTRAINTAPVLDPAATIVTFADTSNVDSVFVAGRAVKRNGKLIGVDLDSVIAKLEASRNHILSAGGLLPDWAATGPRRPSSSRSSRGPSLRRAPALPRARKEHEMASVARSS